MTPHPNPISIEINEDQLIQAINGMTKIRRAQVISTLATYLANDLTKNISDERAELLHDEVDHNDHSDNDWADVGGGLTPAEELAIALYQVSYPAMYYRNTTIRKYNAKKKAAAEKRSA